MPMERGFVAIATGALALGMLNGALSSRWDVARPRGSTPGAIAARYASAMSYDAFVSGDTSKLALWRANEARASRAVDAVLPRAQRLRTRWRLLVVAEHWCPDAANALPYLALLADRSPTVELRIVRRTDAPDLLAGHRLDGREATPLLLAYDPDFRLRGVWIERPAPLRALAAREGARVDEDSLRVLVRGWYLADGGRAMLDEVLALLEGEDPRPDAAPATNGAGARTCDGR